MLDLAKYSSVGAALKDAMERFADEACLIEADQRIEHERGFAFAHLVDGSATCSEREGGKREE